VEDGPDTAPMRYRGTGVSNEVPVMTTRACWIRHIHIMQQSTRTPLIDAIGSLTDDLKGLRLPPKPAGKSSKWYPAEANPKRGYP